MTEIGMLQVAWYLFILLILIKPLGLYMAHIYEGNIPELSRFLLPIEKWIYKICGIRPSHEMDWQSYLAAMLFFNVVGMLAVYCIQRLQFYMPLNPQHFTNVTPDLAFNTAASYVTNTNWQAYSGETTMSYATQMLALTTQNFLSAATGMSLLNALIRGITRHESSYLGNFWVDATRSVLYILLPLSFVFAIFLTSQGVIQNYLPNQKAMLIQPYEYEHAQVTEQTIPMGPVASQVAIKQLGTNGGGFFNANSAHPFENPTPLTNFLEMLALILIPAALCYTYGILIKDTRQGWAILATMLIIFLPFLCLAITAEHTGNPTISQMSVDQFLGNMEGKETRFGVTNSAIWATATTASANGSVNSALSSFTPLGGFVPLWMMHLGEVIFGGAGSGLYGMLMFIIITVFVTGQMVGRTPEYLGKKIEPYEIKMAALVILIMPLTVLVCTAVGVTTSQGLRAIANPGAHGFSEVLYAFTSMGNNNGSAFAGLNANSPFYNILGGVVMLIARYWIAIPVLAIAGSLARKKFVPASVGTLNTHTPIFILFTASIIIVLAALSFLPALSLGPMVEHFLLWSQHGH